MKLPLARDEFTRKFLAKNRHQESLGWPCNATKTRPVAEWQFAGATLRIADIREWVVP
jgi:hypothetical protein